MNRRSKCCIHTASGRWKRLRNWPRSGAKFKVVNVVRSAPQTYLSVQPDSAGGWTVKIVGLCSVVVGMAPKSAADQLDEPCGWTERK